MPDASEATSQLMSAMLTSPPPYEFPATVQLTVVGVVGGVVSRTTWLTLNVGSAVELTRLPMTYAQVWFGHSAERTVQLTAMTMRYIGIEVAVPVFTHVPPPCGM